MRAWQSARLGLALACALGAVACGNPVQDNLIRSLGPENPHVRRGPLHRPGQPCLACHSAAGGRHPQFSVAGTVYQTGDRNSKPAPDVLVTIVDSMNRKFPVATNCAGNFYVQTKDFEPIWPIKVTLHYGNLHDYTHKTQIYRQGSCAGCHTDPTSPFSPGHVFVPQPATYGPVCP